MAGLVIVFVAVVGALCPQSGLAEIQVTPSNLRLDGGATDRVNVTCRLPAGTTGSVSVIRITRNTTAQPGVEQGLAAANALSSTTQGKAVLSSGGLSANEATVSGNTSEKSVTLTMTQVDCQYSGVYSCYIAYSTGTEDNAVPYVQSGIQNLTVTDLPGNITMTVTPQSGDGNYLVGTAVKFLCNGTIGSYDSTVKVTWSWDYQDDMGNSWIPYPNSEDISIGDPFEGTSQCQYHQNSTLTRNLTIEDSKRTYKCTVRQNSDPAYDNYTLGVVKYTGNSSATTSQGDSSPTTSQGNSSPTTYQGDSLPTTYQGDSSPTTSQGNSSPTTSQGNSSPTTYQGDSSPATYQGNSSPTTSQGNSSPTTSQGNSSPTTSARSNTTSGGERSACKTAFWVLATVSLFLYLLF